MCLPKNERNYLFAHGWVGSFLSPIKICNITIGFTLFRIVFWSDREKPLFLTPSGKTLTSRKAVLAAMQLIGGYSQVQNIHNGCNFDNSDHWNEDNDSLSSNIKDLFPHRKTLIR